jgi:short-subunit dehydrogenase
MIEGSLALVTGASSGVGRATALALAQRGADLILHGRDTGALGEVADRTGGTAVVEDLAEPGAAHRLSGRVGAVDILVANAGAGFAGDLSTMDETLIARMVCGNLTAHLELTRLLLPGMLGRGRGAIIFVTSIAGRMGVAGEAVYAATKAGLDVFAESLRLEVRGTGVRVGTLVPAVVDTAFFARRGRPYNRTRPAPVSADAAARAIVRLLESGRAQAYVPRWLAVAVAIRAAAPPLHRALAARFGRSYRA